MCQSIGLAGSNLCFDDLKAMLFGMKINALRVVIFAVFLYAVDS